ncbi:MAG: hypothetical protein Q8L47_00810 [bacterium]|nr:hypothetical protein [bacterium]
MKIKLRLKSLLNIIVQTFKNIARSIQSLNIAHNELPSYKDKFGTDEELINSDWNKVGEDLKSAIDDKDSKTPT